MLIASHKKKVLIGGVKMVNILLTNFEVAYENKCSDRNMEVILHALKNYDLPTNRLTDRRTNRLIGEFYLQ